MIVYSTWSYTSHDRILHMIPSMRISWHESLCMLELHETMFLGHFLVNMTLFSSIGWSNGWIIAYSIFNCKSSVCSYSDDDFIFRLWNIECLRLSLFAYLWINNNNQHKNHFISDRDLVSYVVLNVPNFQCWKFQHDFMLNSHAKKCSKWNSFWNC